MKKLKNNQLLIVLFSVLLVLLSGCSDMTRVEVISAVKECESAGMDSMLLINGWTQDVRDVVCELKDNKAN